MNQSHSIVSSKPVIEYFKGITRNHKITCEGSANISGSTLNKGIKAKEDIIVNMGSVIHAKTQSKQGGLMAEDSTLSEVRVKKQTELTNTTAKTVQVKEGSLTVRYRKQEVLPNFELLKAKLGIEMTNIAANEVISKEGKILAKHCRFEKISSSQNIELIDTQVIGSLYIEIDPKKECRLILNDSTIEGDIIISPTLAGKSNRTINTPMIAHNIHNAPKGSIGFTKTLIIGNVVPLGGVQINLSKDYKLFKDIPEWELEFFKMCCKEGEPIKLGKFDCILSNGKFSEVTENKPVESEKDEPEYCTWQQLKQEIQATFGPGTYTKRLEYKGGIFKVVNGVPTIIQAPPGMKNLEVRIFIQGGNIKGRVIFKDCEGKVEHQLNEPITQEAKAQNLSSPQVEEGPEPDDDFVDPITFFVMDNPYRTPAIPQTHAFNYSTLETLCKGKDTFTCPLTNATYKLADCKPDAILRNRIQREWIEMKHSL